MEFRFLSFNHVKGFWDVEALSIRNILENIIQNLLPDVLHYALPYIFIEKVHIYIISKALPHVTKQFLRKNLSREL